MGAVLGALLSLVLGPHPLRLADEGVGDPVLLTDARAALGSPNGYGTVAVATIRDGQVAWAGFPTHQPVDEHTRYESGSIAKTFTGILLADAVVRGEVALQDPLERHLPELTGTPAGSVTLEELASHRSGLPNLAHMPTAQAMVEDLAGEALTVYTDTTTADLIGQAQTLQLTNRGTMAYSNLGAALVGHALARTGGAPDWPAYVTERLFLPLGMTATRIAPPGDPDPDLITPHLSGGRAVEAWTGTGYAPAGVSVTTTAADLTRYAQAILNGTAPGLSALQPHWEVSGTLGKFARIGLFWLSSGPPEQAIAWHSGGTGGMRTVVAIQPSTGKAVVALNNSTEDVTGLALQLLGVQDGPPRFFINLTESDYYVIPALLFVLIFAIGAVRGRNRLGLITQAVWAVSGAILLWLAAPWAWLPGWIFGATLGTLALGTIAVGLRWTDLSWLPRRFTWLLVPVLFLGAALLAITISVLLRAISV